MAYIQQPLPPDRHLADLFEALVRARGIEAAESTFRRVQQSSAEKILAIGLQQYAERGNARRLTLTAELLAAAGEAGAVCLGRLLDRPPATRPPLIFFVDSIAGASSFTDAQRRGLLLKLAPLADEDTADRLDEIADSLDPDTGAALRALLSNRG